MSRLAGSYARSTTMRPADDLDVARIIDGPTGAGKSFVADVIAARLTRRFNWYFDKRTGGSVLAAPDSPGRSVGPSAVHAAVCEALRAYGLEPRLSRRECAVTFPIASRVDVVPVLEALKVTGTPGPRHDSVPQRLSQVEGDLTDPVVLKRLERLVELRRADASHAANDLPHLPRRAHLRAVIEDLRSQHDRDEYAAFAKILAHCAMALVAYGLGVLRRFWPPSFQVRTNAMINGDDPSAESHRSRAPDYRKAMTSSAFRALAAV